MPLSEGQKQKISENFKNGLTIDVISSNLNLSNSKVSSYLESTFLSFLGEEGERALKIIQKHKNIPPHNLRMLVINRDLDLQDWLCCNLPQTNNAEHLQVYHYFKRFEESKTFYEIDKNFTIQEIICIKNSNLDLEQLSIKLHKPKTLIYNHLTVYYPSQIELDYQADLQKKSIEKHVNNFGTEIKTFQSYRMIISDSMEDMIENAQEVGIRPNQALKKLLPLIFYYLKCSLSFTDITPIIAKALNITLTAHELFHIIFQFSDPILKGFCIEHYSFSNPVPLYYPKLISPTSPEHGVEFEFCSELWYSMQQFNGLISFGLGRASWNPIGKSHLLDLIFETDFVKGNQSKSAFHRNSIDIQMTKNFFGESHSDGESTKWAYIDCNGHSDINVIKVVCQHLSVALIHITFSDWKRNNSQIIKDVNYFAKRMDYIYVFIRDSEDTQIKIQVRNENMKFVFVPNLSNEDLNICTYLKETAYNILHLQRYDNKLVGMRFIESIMRELKVPSLKEIQSNKQLVNKITKFVIDNKKSSSEMDLSFLQYYPKFVDFMTSYYKESSETDKEVICKLNKHRVDLSHQLANTKMSDIVVCFNEILEKDNSVLILWVLSQELSALTNKIKFQKKEFMQNRSIELTNDRYTLEILWRESLLSSKYGDNSKCRHRDKYIQRYPSNFSNYVEKGEPFELIDGDNLRFFNKEINTLLSQLYEKQLKELSKTNEGKTTDMRQAPIVLSILGPQSSGKSTLLNYCFGCKFLTSAGRCTRGIYASLSKLSRSFNRTNQFLILDTEGLDAIKKSDFKDISSIHFDRTMVLFCLAVSQVVLINIKGDIGDELKNLLQICLYSLYKLRVSRIKSPKIFFVLNQQADPDHNKHIESIQVLLSKLSEESNLIDLEGRKISDLIEVSEKNSIVLPPAFNAIELNKPAAKLFNSKVTKLYPTPNFANQCAKLRMNIITTLTEMPIDERAPFKTMSEWMEMSGVVWDTIIKHQDIVRYRNVDELMCNNLLITIVAEVLGKHISCHQSLFSKTADEIVPEIQKIEHLGDYNTLLTQNVQKFEEVFSIYQTKCLDDYNEMRQSDPLLQRMAHLCDEMKHNLQRLLFFEKNKYVNRLKFHIKARLTELKLSERMGSFQTEIMKNLDYYLDKSGEQLQTAFEKIWVRFFEDDDKQEKLQERNDDFFTLHAIFKLESITMESSQTTFKIFNDSDFEIESIINSLKDHILTGFQNVSDSHAGAEDFIFPWKDNNFPIKEMTTYQGENNFEYFGPSSLFVTDNRIASMTPNIRDWIPQSCHSLIKYCSGFYNNVDIVWEVEKNSQVRLLASLLKDPNDSNRSTWSKLIDNISSEVEHLLSNDPLMSQGTVKKLVHYLSHTFKRINYEINYIQAKLTNEAEITITTLVFAYAFKSFWQTKDSMRGKAKANRNSTKEQKLNYFLTKVENHKMAKGNWDRNKMRDNDRLLANQYATDFLEAIKRGVTTDGRSYVEKRFREKENMLSYENISLTINDIIESELTKHHGEELSDPNNIVVRYICNQNDVFEATFEEKWQDLMDRVFHECVNKMKEEFSIQKEKVKQILEILLTHVTLTQTEETELSQFDSDSIFEMVDPKGEKKKHSQTKVKEIPLRATVVYLQKYFDPKESSKQLKNHFSGTFKVDDIKMRIIPGSKVLLFNPSNSVKLDTSCYKKLISTKIFNSESIFNIQQYLKEFLSVVAGYDYEITRAEFEEIVQQFKNEFETAILNCPSQCPCCGKHCEMKHPHIGKCHIQTGHRICSMGGKVWENDIQRQAIVAMCDDYNDDTMVIVPGGEMSWGNFKDKSSNDWNWTVSQDKAIRKIVLKHRQNMIAIWNTFGKGILKYHANRGTEIQYIPYKALDGSNNVEYDVCFVLDGTGSMRSEIDKARISIGQLISYYQKQGNPSKFGIVIYRDHCDGEDLIQRYPIQSELTSNYQSIAEFLAKVKVFGGGDGPEAVLDGLAIASNKYNWVTKPNIKNIIIHIYDAPPHGGLPNFKNHTSASDKKNCCCCNNGTLCKFDWKRDVWDKMSSSLIKYHGISTGENFPEFEETMKDHLGQLCSEFQKVGKELVNDAIVKIFINYNCSV